MTFKSYSWSIGTTSFRTSQLNYKIERQLQLLKEFWKLNPNLPWNPNTQEKYYNFLKENNFIYGEAPRPDKDAREKTSGLVNIGVITNDRRITAVGNSIENLLYKQMDKDNIFLISEDSYYYLLQMLKLQIVDGEIKIRPFIALIYMVEKLDYLSYEEFTYLLPLCKNKYDVKKMVENIKANRMGLDIDEIIKMKIFEMNNYLQAWNIFRQNYPITEETFEIIGLNRKSRAYDRPYNNVYHALVDLIFHLRHNTFEERLEKYKELYNYCQKISGNTRPLWLEYLFLGYRVNSLDEEFDKKFRSLDISKVKNIIDFKQDFFTNLHLFKWKVNLKEYFDLNKRYFSLTDIIKFEDEKIELDMLPKYYFKEIIDNLLDEQLLDENNYKDLFYNNVSLEKISPNYSLNIEDVIRNINSGLGTNLTINTINSYVENEKLKAFNKLIDEKFSNDKILMLLDNIKDRNDDIVNEYVTDNATVPTIFEYILGIAWYRISNKKGNILDYMNLSLDADLLPKTHAGGGMADIVYKYDEDGYPKHDLLIEATLSESTGQRSMEMEPVSRHLGENIKLTNNENDYALFVAPILEERIIMDFRNRKTYCYPKGNGSYTNGLKIIPINIDILKSLIINNVKYDYIYSWFDKAYKSLEPDPVWFEKEILEKV